MSETLLETPLVDWHVAHGGRMVGFAGWRMPVQYRSIVEEHVAARAAAGIFDVSHMGRLAIRGPAAIDWLESLLTRRVAGLPVGRVRYTLITAAPPGTGDAPRILDDALVGRDADAADGTPRLSLVVNAGNRVRVVEWLRGRMPASGVTLEDRTSETAMIAVQGPRAVEVVCGLAQVADAARITALGNYRATTATVAGRPAAVSRTGYTGEDGVELVTDAAAAVAVWDAIHAAAVRSGGAACGLGARDTLRLEAGMPLYGHELREDSDPFAIGLGLAFDLDGRRFPGADHYLRLSAAAAPRRRVGIVFDSKRAAREGDRVFLGGRDVGAVTSGSFAPSVGTGVAMALVDAEAAVVGAAVEAAVRESRLPGRVVPLPFWRRDRTAAG